MWKIELLQNLATIFLRVCPGELKTYVHTKTYTQIFTAALFIIAREWTDFQCD